MSVFMQGSHQGSDLSLVIAEQAPPGVDFNAPYMARQKRKQAAAGALVEAKAKELKQIKKVNARAPPKKQAQITPRYDPCARATRTEVMRLNEYAKRQPGYPTRVVNTSLQWYYDLRTPKVWLQDTVSNILFSDVSHIDAALDLLRLRQKEHPEWFRSERMIFLDTLLGRLWAKHYTDFTNSGDDPTSKRMPPAVWDFHCGELPEFCQSKKTWGLEVDQIYTALHAGGNHWVAALISIPERHVQIWDSILGPRTDEIVAAAVAPICDIFPAVMHLMAPPEERWKYTVEPYTYMIEKNPAIPQNIQTGDCGVFAVKFIEYHSLGMPFPEFLCDKNIKTIRDKLAYDILERLGRTGVEERTEYGVLDLYEGQ